MADSASGASDAKEPVEETMASPHGAASSTIYSDAATLRSDAPLLKEGEVTASVAASAEAADGRPEGYSPTRPRHFYMVFWLMAIGIANDGVQVSTLVFANMRGAAAACAVCTAVTLLLITGIHVQDKTDPWKQVQASAQRGEPTELWEGTVSLEQSVQRLGVGFVAAYGMTCVGTLSAWSAVSALLGLALSARSSADLLVLLECSRPSAVKALRPRTFWALTAWCSCRMAAEITFFAIVAATLHPFVVFCVLLLGFFLQRLTAHEFGYEEPAGLVSLLPVNWARGKTSVLNIAQGKAKKPMPAWPVVLTIWVRFLLLGYLSQLDLPQGIFQSKTLGLAEPMGRDRFERIVTLPLHAGTHFLKTCIGGNAVAWWPLGYDACKTCIGGNTVAWRGFSFQSCSLEGVTDMTTGAMWFRAIVAAMAYVAVPMYLLGSLMLLAVNAKYRRGEVDDDLQQELKGKYLEIKKYTDGRAAAETPHDDPAELEDGSAATDSERGESGHGCARVMDCCHRPATTRSLNVPDDTGVDDQVQTQTVAPNQVQVTPDQVQVEDKGGDDQVQVAP